MRNLRQETFGADAEPPKSHGRATVIGFCVLGALIIVVAVVALPRLQRVLDDAESGAPAPQKVRHGFVDLDTISASDLQRAVDDRIDYIVRRYREKGQRQFMYVGPPSITALHWGTEYQLERFRQKILTGLMNRGYVARPTSSGGVFNIDN